VENTVKSSYSNTMHMRNYWSSAGSASASDNERLVYELAHPVCVVTSIGLSAVQAFWQEGRPVYAPRAVRVHLGLGPDRVHATYTVEDVRQVSGLQTWRLPVPVVASWMALELLGKPQRQPGDNLHYIALSYVGTRRARRAPTRAQCLR